MLASRRRILTCIALVAMIVTIGYFVCRRALDVGFDYYATWTGEFRFERYREGGEYASTCPDITTDGRHIAFSSPQSGHGDIYLYDVKANSTSRITDSPEFEGDPHFVGSAAKLAFIRERRGRSHLWTVDVNTGVEVQLTKGEIVDGIRDVSGDGRCIIVRRSSITVAMGRESKDELIMLDNVDQPIVLGAHAAFSGDGTVVFYTELGSRRLCRRGIISGHVIALGGGKCGAACNSGRYVVKYDDSHANVRSDSLLTLYDCDTSETSELGMGHLPMFDANGRGVIFIRGDDQVWRYDIDAKVSVEKCRIEGLIAWRRAEHGKSAIVLLASPDSRVGQIGRLSFGDFVVSKLLVIE
jgi:hypothetical protein